MELRNAKVSDCYCIAAIGQCVWIDTHATEGVREKIAEYVVSTFTSNNILNQIHSKCVSVFELEGHLVGYAVLSESNEVAEIESLYILPKFQRKGFGKAYIHYILETHAKIWRSCWERNSEAIGFYKSLGFMEAGETYFEMSNEKHRNILFNYGT